MTIVPTLLEGCIVITPRIFNDDRGYFFESYNEQNFNKALGYQANFVQDNQSYSTKGVLRGLHLQKGEHAQAKLVRVTKGEVLDVAVDLRTGSPTYGQHFSVKLSEENNQQLFIPRGFAHGFIVLSDVAVFQYKCDNYYNKTAEGGLHYADPELNIDWGMSATELLVSEKDLELPFLKDAGDLGF
ncbi:dTDP-4-dehydrorhamnose 3,5-epimerase [Mucilaginibacter ginsenosidivorax]|uniref:dTDP-4-dehydrorhamnose 3,5-epimerase n=1 Tax=Mucilaginibacter ginsenosidivorax TaxID=862126 RepID=A0A5B8W3I0_9SPHI|nr:dTDP-4-dehydrorhamnose 3,5-epimerase [Mucilaginibacter ginsenosidivorax]QEC78089.1 dTDP-4-dehydrorhamnose 3,5-epimerase [Mucilaginibacter ginsenosidivorax]